MKTSIIIYHSTDETNVLTSDAFTPPVGLEIYNVTKKKQSLTMSGSDRVKCVVRKFYASVDARVIVSIYIFSKHSVFFFSFNRLDSNKTKKLMAKVNIEKNITIYMILSKK